MTEFLLAFRIIIYLKAAFSLWLTLNGKFSFFRQKIWHWVILIWGCKKWRGNSKVRNMFMLFNSLCCLFLMPSWLLSLGALCWRFINKSVTKRYDNWRKLLKSVRVETFILSWKDTSWYLTKKENTRIVTPHIKVTVLICVGVNLRKWKKNFVTIKL